MKITTILHTLTSLCRRGGFLFQSREICGRFANIWDYGSFGVKLKKALTLTKAPALRADVEEVLVQLQQ